MILITGSNGKIGSSLVKFLKKKRSYKFIATTRSRNYRLINNSCVGLNLLNKNHIKKLFKSYKFKHLIHLAVTRNPLYIKQIRNYETLTKDTLMMINILKHCGNLKSITFTSSIAIYKLPELPFDLADRRFGGGGHNTRKCSKNTLHCSTAFLQLKYLTVRRC